MFVFTFQKFLNWHSTAAEFFQGMTFLPRLVLEKSNLINFDVMINVAIGMDFLLNSSQPDVKLMMHRRLYKFQE